MPNTTTAPTTRVSAYSWFVLTILALVYTLNFLDRQLVGTLGVQIQDELGITRTQLGYVTGTYFAIFYVTISLPVALMADRLHRVGIVSAGAILFSGFTMLCGAAQNFGQMIMARMGVGLGEAGGAPPSYSLVSDYFPPSMRGKALALFSLGVPFGAALGVYAGAKIAAAYGWRMPFYVIGACGVVMGVICLILVREPKRGAKDVPLTAHQTEELVDTPPIPAAEKAKFWETVRLYFSNPVLLLAGLASGAAALTALGQNLGIPQILQREKGMALADYAVYYALVLGIGQGLGGFASGWLVDKLGAKNQSAYALVPAAALALSIPGWLAFIYAPTWQLSLAFLAIPTFLTIFYLAPAIAIVVNSVSPSRRTLSSALLLFLLNGIGFGLGPWIAGRMGDYFADAGAALPWREAMLWMTPFYVLAVVMHLWLAAALKARQKKAEAAA